MKMFRTRAICSMVFGIYVGLADLQFIETIRSTIKIETRTAADLVRAPVRLLGEGSPSGGETAPNIEADLMILVDLHPSNTDLQPFQELGDDISNMCLTNRGLRIAFGTITETLNMSWEFNSPKATDANAFNGILLEEMKTGDSDPAEAMKAVSQRFDLTSDKINILLLMLHSRPSTPEFEEEVANIQSSGITVVIFGIGLDDQVARKILSCPSEGECKNMYLSDSTSYENTAAKFLDDLQKLLSGVTNPGGELVILPANSSGLEGWAIALIVTGSLIAVAIVVAVVVVFIRKRRQNHSS